MKSAEFQSEALSRLNHGAGAEERIWLDPEHCDAVLGLIREKAERRKAETLKGKRLKSENAETLK